MSSLYSNPILRLGPLNPILLRVVTAGGRRTFHALIRWGYLALLILLLLFLLINQFTGSGATLSDLAKAGAQVFQYTSYAQLGMICLLAPVFTAAAITQERDSRTYNILLATPLTNGQIVLGSLLSRLYFVIALLFSGIPVFAITLFYGGVTARSIALSFAISLGTGLFTGALAIAIAVFRLGTGKTVFWFYLVNLAYLVGGWFLDALLPHVNGLAKGTTWITGIHPFLSLESAVDPRNFPVPAAGQIVQYAFPIRWYLQYPAGSYVVLTISASALLVATSAMVLRKIAQRSDVGLLQFIKGLLGISTRERKARHVWANPIAWREAATRAAVSARGITRWATMGLGLAAIITLLVFHARAQLSIEQMRQALMALVILEFSVALLVAANTSAGAVTRERESQTLDLLLCTPITSRYYIWGKLRGLVSFMLGFAAVPTLTVFAVILYDLITGHYGGASSIDPIVYPEVVLELPIFLTVLTAAACMLGLMLSLKWTRTIVAVIVSVGILSGLCAVLGVCGYAAAAGMSYFGLILNSFSPFTAVAMLTDPADYAGGVFGPSHTAGEMFAGRIVIFISILAASALYSLAVFWMYRGMVKNFDMIIRKQHA